MAKCTELKLDEKGSSWKTISLSWHEVGKIEEGLELIEALVSCSSISRVKESVLIRVGKHFAVERKQDGVVVSFQDYEEPKPVDAILDAQGCDLTEEDVANIVEASSQCSEHRPPLAGSCAFPSPFQKSNNSPATCDGCSQE